MNKSNISVLLQRQQRYHSGEQSRGSTASICVIIHDAGVSLMEMPRLVSAARLHQAFIHPTEMMHLVACLVRLSTMTGLSSPSSSCVVLKVCHIPAELLQP